MLDNCPPVDLAATRAELAMARTELSALRAWQGDIVDALGHDERREGESWPEVAQRHRDRLRAASDELVAIDGALGLGGEGRTRWQGQRVAEIRGLKASDRDRTRILLELADAHAEVAKARRDPLDRIATALETLARVARGVRP
ncbi:MAG TPA: hypothetical protein VEB22_15295 [Phycisphaerales bacterium]|nr:hypothetical protein [Phycisphaerales bacterium]